MSYELYGLDVKSKQIIQDTLGENEFMQDVLIAHQVPPSRIDAIEKKSADVFDVRRMRAGNPFTLVKNAADEVEFFIYEKNPAQFVVYDFTDTLSVYEGKQPAIRRDKGIGGYIASTLYQTIQGMERDVRLAKLIEEIYAWTIDFSRLDPEDYVKVVYEEAYVDEASIGITKVLAAQIHHRKRDYYAFYFAQDSLEGYFDEEGQSLKRSFLKSPLKYTAANAKEELNPSLLNAYELEYVASEGTPILSVAKGEVASISRSRDKGRFISIDHGEIYSTEYLHLGKVRDSLQEGSRVQQGEVIAYVGGSMFDKQGSFSFTYWKNGKPTKAETFDLGEETDSIASEFMPDFIEKKVSYMEILEDVRLKKAKIQARQE